MHRERGRESISPVSAWKGVATERKGGEAFCYLHERERRGEIEHPHSLFGSSTRRGGRPNQYVLSGKKEKFRCSPTREGSSPSLNVERREEKK